MPTPSGTISLANVNTELGLAATTTISMNQANVRTLAGVGGSGTPISMQNLQNKSNRVTASATISSDTTNYVLNTAKASGYSAGNTDMTLTINSGVTVYSTSTGSYALTVDTSWATGDTVTIVNNGTILGRGGNAGPGGQLSVATGNGPGSPGSSGGPALLVQRALTLNNINRFAGGGGGGGGGGAGQVPEKSGGQGYGQGNGGGGGIGNGSGAPGAPAGGPYNARAGGAGSAGTLTTAGTGGSNGQFPPSGIGGTGGGYGSSGSSGANGGNGPTYVFLPPGYFGIGGGGGGAGAAIVGNSNITYINTGTRNGSIS